MRHIEIENKRGLVRDIDSRALLNTDINALEAHRRKVKQTMEMVKLKNEVECIKNDLKEMKELLKNFILGA